MKQKYITSSGLTSLEDREGIITRLGTTVLGPGASIGGVEEDRTSTSGVRASDSATGAFDEDLEGMVALAALMRSIIGGRRVYAMWFCSNSCLMCSSNTSEMLEIAASTLHIILCLRYDRYQSSKRAG